MRYIGQRYAQYTHAYAAAAGNTPGWYTLQGHHHCGVSQTGDFAAGCLCTDPKKCIGNAGTGAPYCKAHPEECWPVDKPNWCAYWYASDQKYCNLCEGPWKYTGPAGSGAKPCPGGASAPAASTPAATTTTTPAPADTGGGGGGSNILATLKQNWIIVAAVIVVLILVMRR